VYVTFAVGDAADLISVQFVPTFVPFNRNVPATSSAAAGDMVPTPKYPVAPSRAIRAVFPLLKNLRKGLAVFPYVSIYQ
jgi:hypothetical protein